MPDSICAAIIGKGRVATTLGRAWESSGLSIGAFCNRSHEIPDGFTTLDALCVEDCSQLPSDINVAMIAVSDDAVPAIIDQLPSGIFSIHFSGSLPNPVNGAVIWPVQSVQAQTPEAVHSMPLVVTAHNALALEHAQQLATRISSSVIPLEESNRQRAHLAAVFGSNFSNHLFGLAQELCEEAQIPWELLQPLVSMTAQRALAGNSAKNQTGPAIRKDQKVIDAHLETLKNRPDLAALYRMLTESIQTNHPHTD